MCSIIKAALDLFSWSLPKLNWMRNQFAYWLGFCKLIHWLGRFHWNYFNLNVRAIDVMEPQKDTRITISQSGLIKSCTNKHLMSHSTELQLAPSKRLKVACLNCQTTKPVQSSTESSRADNVFAHWAAAGHSPRTQWNESLLTLSKRGPRKKRTSTFGPGGAAVLSWSHSGCLVTLRGHTYTVSTNPRLGSSSKSRA